MQRLGKNTGGYHGEQIDIRAVLAEIGIAARKQGWNAEFFHRSLIDVSATQPATPLGEERERGASGQSDQLDLIALHRPALRTVARPFRIYISCGIHGDEPAGPLAALQLLRANHWPEHAEIILLPCLNPVGFASNRRENAQGIDLNRDYLNPQSPEIRAHVAWLEPQPAFDLCLCLHEDWEAHGFYVYELNPAGRPSLAAGMIAAAAAVCPIDLSPVIEGRAAQDGIIRPRLDPAQRPQWPEAFWLLQHKTRLSYTLEAPSDFPLSLRVKALAAAVEAALASPLLP